MAFDANPFVMRYLQQSAAVHLIEIAVDGTVLACNNGAAKALKMAMSEVVGRPVWMMLAGEHQNLLRARFENPSQDTFQLAFVDREGAPYALDCQLQSKPGGFLLIGECAPDDRVHTERNLLRLNRELENERRENGRRGVELERKTRELKQAHAMLLHGEKMAALGQMTAGVAHEINNPVGFVLNNHEMLCEDFKDMLGFVQTVRESLPVMEAACPDVYARLSEESERLGIERISHSISRKLDASLDGLERIARIASDLRNFSRLDETDFKICDLEDNIRSVIRFLGPMMRTQRIAIEPRFGPVGEVRCCPGALNQAVSNVVVNAIQASAPGSKVTISTSREGDDFVIAVADAGAGIAPDIMDRMFEPFFTTKPEGAGTGLGLSITRQVIASHGGRIHFDSGPGRGTTVRMSMPAR